MAVEVKDPTIEIQNRGREIATKDPWAIDKQEEAERMEAAKAYFGEDEQHFVDYCQDCINQSVNAQKGLRQVQSDCWNVYLENEPVSYADKDEWQARIIVPKPFQTVQFGAAAVKKAFTPQFLSIVNAKNDGHADFWQKTMEHQLDQRHANFALRFTDSTVMALAVGISQEMIPRWIRGKGLEFSLIEPWKIHRDPDALPRDPQAGMYWIHQEWLDYYVLKAAEDRGRYFNVARVQETTGVDPDNPFMTKEAIEARKHMIYERSKFRKLILTSEFWGMVLDKKGNMLLPRATYTVAGGRVVQLPEFPPYRTLRWPGISFSPLPDILRFGGRGLLEGIITIWEAMNNIMCLHQDYLQWVVNPPLEINIDALDDPTDVEQWPGKKYLTRDTAHGQQAIRAVQRRSRTSDVLSNMQFYDQQFQRGSFVTDSVQGLPGWRKNITFRESAMNLDSAMAVYSLMGENVEDGAINVLTAAAEVIEAMAGYNDFLEIFEPEELEKLGIKANAEADSGVSGVPGLDGSFSVSGMQALLKEAETLKHLIEVIIPLSEKPRYAQYLKPYKILKSLELRIKLTDEGVIVTEDEAKIIETHEQLRAGDEAEAAEGLRHLQELLGISDLVAKLQDIDAGDMQAMTAKIDMLEKELTPPAEEGEIS